MPARGAPRSRGSASCCSPSCCRTSTSDPIQPALGETNLNIVTQGGPTTPGYNEFTPLFERNGRRSASTACSATTTPRAASASASALYDRYSISAGGIRLRHRRLARQRRHPPQDLRRVLPGRDHAGAQRQLEITRRSTTTATSSRPGTRTASRRQRPRHRPGQLPRRPALVADAELGRAAVVHLQRHQRQGGAGRGDVLRYARSRRPNSRTKATSRRSSTFFAASNST